MRKKKKRLSGVRSGIRVYGSMPEKNSAGQQSGSAWVLNAFSVFLLAAAWWNALLSVFSLDINISRLWLYGGLAALSTGLNLLHRKAGKRAAVCVFLLTGILIAAGWAAGQYFSVPAGERTAGAAAALVTVPLLEVWTLVKKSGRAKAAAGLLIPVPLIAAACAGSFQPAVPCWLLLIAGGFYFAAGIDTAGPGAGNSAQTWLQSFAVLAVLCLAAVLSASAGRLLDAGRDIPGGFYQEGRAFFRAGVVDRLERMVTELTQGETEEGQGADPDQEEPRTGEQDVQEEIPERELDQEIMEEDGGMQDLNSLSRFTPTDEPAGEVTVEERPAGTVYVPEHYGITYTGSSWIDLELYEEAGGWQIVYGSGQYVDTSAPETLLAVCQSYPPDLQELEGLIDSGWDTGSIESVGREIDREFERRAVYDTAPGATPPNEDFVEYFLFERGSGFCVHFASAAVLLYRMSGYPARYVSGYAVPASAFRETENGEYRAQLDGTMGHAWAQVYDARSGEWINEEHTPSAAPAVEEQNTEAPQPGIGDAESADPAERTDASGAAGILAAILIPAAVLLTVFLQARVRRRRMRRRFSVKRDGAGIICMYDSILRTSEFLGCCGGKMPNEKLTRLLSEDFPEISAEEWKWMEERTLESLFYHLDEEEESWKRMTDLYCRFLWAARGRMNFRKRWLYDYICCFGCVYRYTNEL